MAWWQSTIPAKLDLQSISQTDIQAGRQADRALEQFAEAKAETKKKKKTFKERCRREFDDDRLSQGVCGQRRTHCLRKYWKSESVSGEKRVRLQLQ